MYQMHLQIEHYNKVKSGTKCFELRLLDEKRKTLEIGDIVQFYNSHDKSDLFDTKVINLYKYSTLEELCDNIDCSKCGFRSNGELLAVTEKYYPLKKQLESGVIAIEIERV